MVRCSVRLEVAPARAHPADTRAAAAILPGQLAGGFPTGHTATRLELAFGSRLAVTQPLRGQGATATRITRSIHRPPYRIELADLCMTNKLY